MTTQHGSRTVRVEQGAQPVFDGVRVGVQLVGEHRGELKARLMIRDDHTGRRVDVLRGGTEDLYGVGTLTLVDVHPDTTPGQGAVTLAFEAAGG